MNCDECADLLSEFIDERLPGETAAAVAAHLDVCAKCAALEAELRVTVSLLTGLERQTPEVDIAAAVQARLERKLLIAEPVSKPVRAFITPWRFAGIGAAAAAVILAALYVWMPPAANQIASPEVAQEHLPTTHGIAPEATLPQPSLAAAPSALQPAPAGTTAAAKPTQTAGASPAGGAGGAVTAYRDFAQPANGRTDAAGKIATTRDGAVAGTDEKAASRFEERAEIRGTTPASPNAESDERSARSRSAGVPKAGGGFKAAPEATPAGPSVANAPSELTRKDSEKVKSLGYLGEAEAQSKPKAEVAQAPPASLSLGMFAREPGDMKNTAVPAVTTYYFEGKASDVALEFLALLPAGKKPLPQGALDLDALKAAAAGRNVSIVEFSDARVVLDYSVTPADDEKIVAALTAKDRLTRQVVLSTVASLRDEDHISQAEPPLSTELKKENPQLASAKEKEYVSNAEPALHGEIAAETKRGASKADELGALETSKRGALETSNGRALESGTATARYRVIFIRKPVAPIAPAAPTTPAPPPSAPGS